MNKIKIGLLELGHRENTDSLTAIQQILDYAIEADNLFFSRFWLGEHHPKDTKVPYTSPDILLTIIAGMTDNIRIGSAGTLLNIYKSYNVVTNYKLLNNLFSDRIDLGLSRNFPDNLNKYFNKMEEHKSNLFDEKVEEVYNLINKETYNYTEKEIVIPPFSGSNPEVWYLSNSYSKFNDAIKYKLNYCRSIFHGSNLIGINYNKEELLEYKSNFFNTNSYYPKISLAIAISIDDTIEKALKKYQEALKRDGVLTSEAWGIIPVTIDSLWQTLYEYQDLYGIDEFILYDTETDNLKKIKNIKNISHKFQLKKNRK